MVVSVKPNSAISELLVAMKLCGNAPSYADEDSSLIRIRAFIATCWLIYASFSSCLRRETVMKFRCLIIKIQHIPEELKSVLCDVIKKKSTKEGCNEK